MEVLVDLDEDLGPQYIVFASHLSLHLLISHVSVGKSQSGLRVRLGIDLVPVERYETGV